MKFCDLHNDLITVKSFEDSVKYLEENSIYIDKIILAIWTTRTKYNNYTDICSLIKKYNSLEKSEILFGIEDISALEEKFERILELNIFYASLTWNYDNNLGGGAYGEKGLTDKGKDVLKKLNYNNVVLDTAHLNRKTFWSCIDFFEGNIINSHTCFNSVFKHKRNIDDDQISAIITKGGIIGLALVGDFLSSESKANMYDVARHIDYFIQKYGDKNLCLGTDFFGTDNLPKNLSNYSELYRLVEYLQKIGYNKDTVERIFYKNFEDFLRLINEKI